MLFRAAYFTLFAFDKKVMTYNMNLNVGLYITEYTFALVKNKKCPLFTILYPFLTEEFTHIFVK